jgi:hypothetical protein
MSNNARGLLFIVSAPSGAGKTTLVERLVEQLPNLKMSRSYTSRAARQGETDGVDYNFVSRDRFEAMAAASEFLELADVFGNLSAPGRPTPKHSGRRQRCRAGHRCSGRAEVRARDGGARGVRDAAVLSNIARTAVARAQQGQRAAISACRWRATKSPLSPVTSSS